MPPVSPVRILLIDDSADLGPLIQSYLDRSQIASVVDWAASVAEGFDCLASQPYSLCLVDYDLGETQTGLDLIRQVRARGDDIPLILITGHSYRDVALAALEAGATDYLDKINLNPEILERVIRYALERVRHLRELRSRETLLRQVFETVNVGLFIEQHQRMVYVNPMVGLLLGYPLEQLHRMSFLELVHPGMRDLMRDWIVTGPIMASLSQSEIALTTIWGREVWISLNLSMIEYEGESAVLGAFVNMTKNREIQQALAESERRFRALTENSYDAVILVGADGRLTYFSPATERVTGYPIEPNIGQSVVALLGEFVHPDDVEPVLSDYMAVLQNPDLGTRVFRCRYRQAAGTWIWLECAITNLLADRSVASIVINARDITPMTQALEAESDQRALAEALRDAAAALNSTLQLDEVLDRILSNVSRVVPHDWANVMLVEDGFTRIVGYKGYHPDAVPRLLAAQFYISDTPSYKHMLRTRQPLLVADTRAFPGWDHTKGVPAVRSYMGAPIITEGRIVGFINLDSTQPDFFRLEHAAPLQAFANQVAVALHNARTYQQARELAANEERQRLARDLHDAVSQTLFSANVIAETLSLLIDTDLNEVRFGLGELSKLTQGALAEMRTLLVELRPSALAETDITILLNNLVKSLKTRTDARIALELEGSEPDLKPDLKISLYRIAQEALNNTIKHARANQIILRFAGNPWRARLTIQDDGCGFDPNGVSGNHMGLRIMRERAAAANLALRVDSAVGQGTLVEALWTGVDEGE